MEGRMSELTSKFSKEDLETLIESIGDWELMGSQEFNFLNMIEDAAMPPEDHEAFQVMRSIRDHYRARKQQILDNRAVRQEKAVFLKAKLMLVRRDMNISDLFEMTADSPGPVSVTPPKPPTVKKLPSTGGGSILQGVVVTQQKLEMAEFFIRDLGVWEHYEKFLAEKKAETSKDTPDTPDLPDISRN